MYTDIGILDTYIILLLLSLLVFFLLKIFSPAYPLDNFIPQSSIKSTNWGNHRSSQQGIMFQLTIFADPNFDIVVEVQKAEKVKVKVYYFKILKIHWI